ncbi:hypothetical protein HZB02_00275 [Candidatus Woesearchaeota archaeon]|nr:hypothetical protein [Candidatus Woesearchaeota archaeon]
MTSLYHIIQSSYQPAMQQFAGNAANISYCELCTTMPEKPFAYQPSSSSSPVHATPRYTMSASSPPVQLSLSYLVLSYHSPQRTSSASTYETASYGSSSSYTTMLTPEEQFKAEEFIVGDSETFVDTLGEIRPFVEEMIFKTTGTPLDTSIQMTLCCETAFNNQLLRFGGETSNSILGFAIHEPKPRVFVKAGSMEQVLLTFAHEIGHVLSPRLPSTVDEEAKAFAFTLACMEKIKEHNIAGVGEHIRMPKPAENGIHNTALDKVMTLLRTGISALDLFGSMTKHPFQAIH